MFCVRITLRPTAALTFRRVPFSTTELLTYPFVPPTTFSGYLDRMVRLAQGKDLPEFHERADLHCYILPRSYHVLAAFASPGAMVHSTPRQGIREFDHVAFSRLQRHKDGKNYQLYRWEYLLTDILVGEVLHEDEHALAPLLALHNYGCQLGKEGWAYVEQIEGPFPLVRRRTMAQPSTLVPAMDAFQGAARFFPLYRYAWREDEVQQHDVGAGPAPINGFLPFFAALMDHPVEMDYYQGNGVCIPVSLLEYF